MKFCFLVCTLAMLMITQFAQAQDSLAYCGTSCCCNDEIALPSGLMYGHSHKKGEWMFSYRMMNMSMKGISSGNVSIEDSLVFTKYLMAPKSMRMTMHMLMGMYGITNRLSAMAMVNFTTMQMEMAHFTDGEEHDHGSSAENTNQMNSTGIGDVKLSLIYALWNKEHVKVFVNGGLSLPAGRIDLTGDQAGMTMYINKRLPYAMQQGSGTIDVLPGVTFLSQQKKYTLGAQASGTIRTGKNYLGYALGDELTGNLWMAYRWHSFFSSSVRAEGLFSERILGEDGELYKYNEPSANPKNYGGQKVLVHLGTVWAPTTGIFKNTKAGFEYGIPVYQFVHGVQSPQKWSVNAMLSINI